METTFNLKLCQKYFSISNIVNQQNYYEEAQALFTVHEIQVIKRWCLHLGYSSGFWFEA